MKGKIFDTPVFSCCAVLFCTQAAGQNIINDTIQVGMGSVVELVFSSQPNGVMPEGDGSYEVGGGSRKSLTVKALKNGAKDQPLRVAEGGRKHEFVLVFDEKAPPRQIDWSNMRELRKYVKGKKDKADKALAETNQLYERGNHEAALQKYRRLYFDTEDPERAFIKGRIADCETKVTVLYRQNYNEAMENGTRFAAAKEYREAVEAYELALKNLPSDTAAANRLQRTKSIWFRDRIRVAQQAGNSRNFLLAKEAYEEAKAINPDEFGLYANAYAKVIPKANDQAYQQHRRKGDLALEVRNLKEAREAYEAALQLEPNDAYCTGKQKEWSRLQEKIIENESKEAEYYALLSQAKRLADRASTTGEYDQAIEAYKKASKLFAKRQFPKDRITALTRMKSGSLGKR